MLIASGPRRRATSGVVSILDQTAPLADPGSLRVFPFAEGYGSTTRHAYDGSSSPTIIRVTNLNNSGLGSLRAAVESSGPRIIIFETSGTITLSSQIVLDDPYCFIAGQTAPSPGITVREYGILITSHHVVIQHLRVRVGDHGTTFPVNAGPDGLLCYTTNSHEVHIDHCSISWVSGEPAGTVSPPATSNVTYSNNIMSEAIHFSIRVPENSHGLIVYGQTHNIAVLRNLFYQNVERNPEVQDSATCLVINNVMYGWGHTDSFNYYPSALFMYGARGDGVNGWKVTARGNKFIKSPDMPSGKYAIYTYSGTSGSEIYENDNAVEGVTLYGTNMGDRRVGSEPVSSSGITILASSAVEAHIQANVGARPADRDAVDLRVLQYLSDRDPVGEYLGLEPAGHEPSSQDDMGGWPTLAVNPIDHDIGSHPLPADPHTVSTNGYTKLELWMWHYAPQVETGSGGW